MRFLLGTALLSLLTAGGAIASAYVHTPAPGPRSPPAVRVETKPAAPAAAPTKTFEFVSEEVSQVSRDYLARMRQKAPSAQPASTWKS